MNKIFEEHIKLFKDKLCKESLDYFINFETCVNETWWKTDIARPSWMLLWCHFAKTETENKLQEIVVKCLNAVIDTNKYQVDIKEVKKNWLGITVWEEKPQCASIMRNIIRENLRCPLCI